MSFQKKVIFNVLLFLFIYTSLIVVGLVLFKRQRRVRRRGSLKITWRDNNVTLKYSAIFVVFVYLHFLNCCWFCAKFKRLRRVRRRGRRARRGAGQELGGWKVEKWGGKER